MKVAMHVDGPELRGSERQALLIARGLRARGHDVVLSCRAGGLVHGTFAAEGFRLTTARPRGDADVFSGLAFTAWLRRERPDAALLTSWNRLFGASLAARTAGVPRIVQRLGLMQGIPASGPSRWKYRRALLRQTDLLVVNSAALGERFHAQLPELPAARIRVVENAVDFTPAPPAPIRAELGLGADELLLVAAGGLERRKGFDLLIEAAARVGDARMHVAIAGRGGAEPALRAQAAELGVDVRTHLLGQRSDLPALFAAADGFVLASRGDSLANVMLEAMAAGLPVLATDVPGSRRALEARDGRPAAGWIVGARDAGELARGLEEATRALRTPGEARAAGEEARWRAEHWFGTERMVDGYEAALRGEPAGG